MPNIVDLYPLHRKLFFYTPREHLSIIQIPCIQYSRNIDPACGSGNFLTETYISIRRLENRVLEELLSKQIFFADEVTNPVQVSIAQFYGIEINDFAVSVAKTALWIAESKMLLETQSIVNMPLDFFPLRTNAYIHEGNALRLDWEEIVPRHKLNYIIGNPPFVGGMYMSTDQKAEVRKLFADLTGAGEMDYVTGWYKKTVDYVKTTNIHSAFVSTNSICQGNSVIAF